MATPEETLIASLLGADTQTEIAAANPWSHFTGIAPAVTDIVTKSYLADLLSENGVSGGDSKDALLMMGVSSLLGGVMQGAEQKHQGTLSERYVDATMKQMAGGTLTPEEIGGLPGNLYESTQRKALLWDKLQQTKSADFMQDIMKTKYNKVAEKSGELEFNRALSKEAGGVEGSGQDLSNPITKGKVDLEDKYRKEFNALPDVKDFNYVKKSAGIILEALEDPSATSDLELVRYAILLIEPGMAVREGEQAAVTRSQSVPEAWKGQLGKALRGEAALGTEMREGLRRLAFRAYEGNQKAYNKKVTEYKHIADHRGLDADMILYTGESPSLEDMFGNMQKTDNGSGKTYTIRNKTTGETKQVGEAEAKALGIL